MKRGCPHPAPGLFVAVLGPDGSGKSTVIELLRTRLKSHFVGIVQGHWRPGVLPDLGVCWGTRTKPRGPVTDPHGKPPHSRLLSAARLLYYWLDYWLGYWPRIRTFTARNHLVIFDRYVGDLWCDPRRYRLGWSGAWVKRLCRCCPQPDLTFVLVAAPEVIHPRKREIAFEDLRTLLDRYAALARDFPRAHPVDCSRPAGQVADEIAGSILDSLRLRVAKAAPGGGSGANG